ncbi:hypothetical protein H072_6744 [Dactylellina haptotyla CBS 200.50]|uniref:Uncharacterized protein n=1 Tax=Dactylellina haptotyla (strain CBS 200.50) TaxID=1284197 RepID=S8AEH0_DACHA|nr:hypothetical protein H072_6744 [Dactylellina haptotyla CBS 200.50]
MGLEIKILPFEIPRESLNLGRLVTEANFENPTEDFHDSSLLTLYIDGRNTRIIQNHITNPHTRTEFVSKFSSNEAPKTIEVALHRVYQLEQSATVFESICEDKDTREWLEVMMRTGFDIYMIAGFDTIEVTLSNAAPHERPRELVHKVKYNRIAFSWFSIKTMETRALRKNQWLPKKTIRVSSETEATEDMVSAVLVSETEQDSLGPDESPDGDGEYSL